MSHFLLMTLYAFQVSLFFSLLWRRTRPAQVRIFMQLFGAMMIGALALGWLMYPFPAGPPGS